MRLLFFFSTLLLGASGSDEAPTSDSLQLQALHCPPCERIHCSTRRALRLQCKGGVTTGICGCCPVCAKTEGESCGGTWDYLGKCDEGLVCIHQEEGDGKPEAERKGVCKAVIEAVDSDSCHPECTKEYCQANPLKVCSARFASLEKKSPQDTCQHTSCSSCLLLQDPPCPQACTPSDTTCLHHFGKCVRGHLTTAANQVCNRNLQTNGRFVCFVPAYQHPSS
ncbi:unnamed protein product [Ophioblennius macclurei]